MFLFFLSNPATYLSPFMYLPISVDKLLRSFRIPLQIKNFMANLNTVHSYMAGFLHDLKFFYYLIQILQTSKFPHPNLHCRIRSFPFLFPCSNNRTYIVVFQFFLYCSSRLRCLIRSLFASSCPFSFAFFFTLFLSLSISFYFSCLFLTPFFSVFLPVSLSSFRVPVHVF